MKTKVFLSSVLAGMCIGLGGFIFLTLGGVQGAIGFTLGLICIVYTGLNLFTGKAGQIPLTMPVYGKICFYWEDLGKLFKLILPGNILGGLIAAILFVFCGDYPELRQASEELIRHRLEFDWWEVLVRAIGCGLIMDLIVNAWITKKSIVPILFGVPGFIICGFLHSIAEPFYIFTVNSFGLMIRALLIYYPFVVIGNFIGCRIRKMLI